MELSIRSKPALLGIQTQNAQVKLHNAPPILELKTEKAELNMQVTLPKVEIDQKQCFSESGLKGILELSSENVRDAVSQMYASVGRIAEQGNALTDIHTGGNPIADQAYYNAYDQFDKDYNMVTMPKSRPKITVIEGKVNLNPTQGKITATPRLTKPELDYQPGKVDIYLRQKADLQIDFKPSKLDMKV